MQGWVVQRSLQWYHLSSSNLKLFLVWTQLRQAGKLFFCIFTLFPQHRTSLDRMQWYALAKPLAYALTMHMALHVVSARNRIRNPGRRKHKQTSHKYSTTLWQQSTVFPFSCARKASTGKSTVSARSVRDLRRLRRLPMSRGKSEDASREAVKLKVFSTALGDAYCLLCDI